MHSRAYVFKSEGEAFFLSFVLPCFRVVLNVGKKKEGRGRQKGWKKATQVRGGTRLYTGVYGGLFIKGH